MLLEEFQMTNWSYLIAQGDKIEYRVDDAKIVGVDTSCCKS